MFALNACGYGHIHDINGLVRAKYKEVSSESSAETGESTKLQ